jgi:uncharacterized protein (DUF2252 family)
MATPSKEASRPTRVRPRRPKAAPYLSPPERKAFGRARRAEVPRSSHAPGKPGGARPDPIALLEEQASGRVPELVPIRYGRMSASPFAFFRGAAYIMASDLATSPKTGIRVQLCGDAHLGNFGVFASPERDLVFDLNDFDETLAGPWEWDIKRLAASIAVAARDRGIGIKGRSRIVQSAVAQYRNALHRFAGMNTLDVWYARADESELSDELRQLKSRQARDFESEAAKARRKDSARAFTKLAHHVNGNARIAADPPLIVPVEDLLPDLQARQLNKGLHSLFEAYRASLSGDLRQLVDRYQYADAARKVVGVGSVGTRAWVVLLLGRDSDDPLFLQAKEASRSVLEPFVDKSEFDNQGRRVVEGQRLMQATSDIFLGWLRTTDIDGESRDFYLRQLWDWKGSADVTRMRPADMSAYGRLCAWTLARAHARSGDAIAIAAYLGSADVFDRAVTAFAENYADQNERDHTALLEAIESGRLEARTGL